MTERSNDILVIGGGHNGLVCAAYLAKGGRSVQVLEAAPQVGGAAVTREFAPGFRVSGCAHLLNLLDADIARELELERHGLKFAATGLATVALAEQGEHLTVDANGARGGGISADDAKAFTTFDARMARFAGLLRRLYSRRAPLLRMDGMADAIELGKTALDIRRLGRDDMRELMRIAAINVFDILEEQFDSDLLKGAIALDGVLGTNLGARSNNSVLNLLHRRSGAVGGRAGALAIPRGGMGSVSEALAAAAAAHGAHVRTNAAVKRIVIENGVATGVELEGGEVLRASVMVSNADPKTTLLGLLGARHLDTGFARRVQHQRARGTAAKLHLALDDLPGFRGLDQNALGQRLVIAPGSLHIEHAFDEGKYGAWSQAPVMELILPSVHDASLAPAGKHVLSAIVQYVPYALKGGWNDAARAACMARAIDTISAYAPDLRGKVLHSELLTPADIEREMRITGGHWHHGELAFDQFLMLRPVPGAAHYATPVPGLYLCGAGCHPGGGVMGTAGRHAARAVLEQAA
jgi:phytoene dehydrogenase-like protein